MPKASKLLHWDKQLLREFILKKYVLKLIFFQDTNIQCHIITLDTISMTHLWHRPAGVSWCWQFPSSKITVKD